MSSPLRTADKPTPKPDNAGKHWWWSALVVVTLVLAGAGCSSEGDDSRYRGGSGGGGGSGGIRGGNTDNPWVQGGQTGALMPLCGLTAAAAGGNPVPGGDGGLVLQTGGCAGDFSLDEVRLLDAEGMPIDFEVEMLEDGNVLLHPVEMLEPGQYMIDGVGSPASTSFTVAEPSEGAPPMKLGGLHRMGAGCGADFILTFEPEALDYLPLLRLSASVDGAPTMVWFDYGVVAESDGMALLSLPKCWSSCLDNGQHTLTVIPELAGELGTLEPLTVTFTVDCNAPSASSGSFGGSGSGGSTGGNSGGDGGDGGALGCSATPTPAHSAPGNLPWLLAWIAPAIAWLRRRRRPPD